jgi:hypothetical protein
MHERHSRHRGNGQRVEDTQRVRPRQRPVARRVEARGVGAARRRRRNCAARRAGRRAQRTGQGRRAQVVAQTRQRRRVRSVDAMATGNRSRKDGGMSSRSSMFVVITTENCGPGRTHSLVSGFRQRADSGESVIASSVLSASPEARSTSSTTSRPPGPRTAPRADRRPLAPLPAVLTDGHPRAGDLTRRQVLGAHQSFRGEHSHAVMQRGVRLARARRTVEQAHARSRRPTRQRGRANTSSLFECSRSMTLRLLKWESDNGRR